MKRNFIQSASHRHAFSLLELSIVIAIIGLISGAVLMGQNLVANAKLTSTVNDAKYYRDAFNRFEEKYSAIPGDIPRASMIWTNAGNGDGNGFVAWGQYTFNDGEMFLTFQHLANAGFIEGTYTGQTGGGGTGSAILGKNIPAGPLGNSGYYFRDVTDTEYPSGNAYFYQGNYQHPLFIGASVPGWVPEAVLFTAADAYKIDDKYDDGLPGTGTIRSFINTYHTNCSTNATTYKTAYKGPACILIFTQN